MTGGFGLNVTNQMAAQFYADHGLNSVLILPSQGQRYQHHCPHP